MVANPRLLKSQGVEQNKYGIDALHEVREMIFGLMEEEDNIEKLKAFDKQLDDIEFKLQELWNFPKDAKYHRFWDRPKCTCPKMDNDDWYPTGRFVINESCPLHGGKD